MRVTVLSTLLTVASASLYAPEHVACPADLAIRLAGPATKQTLHPEECRYTAVRRRHRVPQALKAYLGDRAAKVYGGDLDAVSYTKLPNIAISLSGGGDRAALYGAGVLRALDGREPDSVAKGTGGLLQSATYMSALSGGSWALSSFVFNGMPTIVDLVLGDGGNFPGWNLAIDLFSASTNATLENAFIGELLSDLNGKISNGFPVSFVDFWGRALARHFLPETTPENFFDPSAPTDHGATVTLSGAVHLQPYVDHDLPFPIIVSKPFSPNNHDAPLAAGLAPLTSVTYEFTPLEFGSFDNQLSAFIPIESLGSRMNAGRPIDLKSCATGFDRASFAFGCSSALFSYFNITNNPTWTTPGQPLNFAWNLVKTTFSKAQPNQQIDIGAIPNPFLGINAGKYEDSAETQLRLVDGGESGENDPLTSLVVKARNVDIVIVAAADGDTTDNTPSGFALVISQLRGQLVGAPHLPPLPQSVVTFVAQGLNRRPTFFGCNATPSKLAGQKAPAAYPFLVYLPNAGPTLVSDTNTTQLQYPDVQTGAFLDAATSIATSGYSVNGTSSDPDWGTALACAVVERTRAKTGVDRTPTCEPLFARYCWNEKETTPPAAAPPARRRAVVTL